MQQVALVDILTWQFEVEEIDVVEGEVAVFHHSLFNRALVHHHRILRYPQVFVGFCCYVCLLPTYCLLSCFTGVKDDKNKGQKHGLVKGLNTLKNQQKITGSNLQQMLNERRGQWRTAVQSQEFFRTL